MPRSKATLIDAANTSLLVRGELETVAEYFTADYVAHGTEQDFAGGHDFIRKFVRAYRRAFSEIEVRVEVLVQSKNRVAWQRTVRAKHTGAFKGFPPTNRTIVWRDMITTEFRDGLIAEDWVLTDLAEKLLLARKR